ncbi:GGDEF domain-containing protein [Asanoa siamensis]|uniref:GGDEF domain-containing protein n=1 Tax=Asanoa siamensis TaxID=926357 RepID=A0ABQ4D1K3_9ACTN|nr:GGDEF domain-containing protein [Asanoa siamensis]GIF76987.1 hypothetical protein Asi02nite_65050 [Asanoa siamensis]
MEPVFRQRKELELGILAARAIAIIMILIGRFAITPRLGGDAIWATGFTFVAVGVLAAGSALGVLALIRFREPGYSALGVAQLVLDFVAISGIVALSAATPSSLSWPVLAIPIIEAAVRRSLSAALVMWLALSGVYILLWLNLYNNVSKPHPSLVIGLGLILAVLGGLNTRSRNRQVDALHLLQSWFRYQACHDSMTGLGNRALLNTIEPEFSENHAVAAIVIDLNGFKQINDDLGHSAGDAVLVEVAERLKKIVRGPDIIVRLGGDEFALLLRDVTREEADAVARRTTADISTPMLLDGRNVAVGASIGIATSSMPGTASVELLLRQADVAMYNAKHGSRRRFGDR